MQVIRARIFFPTGHIALFLRFHPVKHSAKVIRPGVVTGVFHNTFKLSEEMCCTHGMCYVGGLPVRSPAIMYRNFRRIVDYSVVIDAELPTIFVDGLVRVIGR